MSRPNTRSKNKRHRTENTDDPSSEILRKIHLTGELSESDISQLYSLWKPTCHGCRVNSKDSPNCFCGLIPPPNGTRKTGLWQKMSDLIVSLGPDPSKDLRSSNDTPAGLTNLGATCYANSILQCLYMNTLFRAGIFSVEPEILKRHPVLDQLARLFAQLHSSKMAFIDSAPFIKTLELDNGVQQDSHEFLTLFLSLLEHSLNQSKGSTAKTIVQDLFRGSVSNLTRCSVCGKDSEASSKTEDFYELELNIKGLNSLDESLDDYLSLEQLHGENQYFCESCGMRVDATRCIKLRSLPPVLNFQLKRYVFLPKTTTKKKITSAFSFPRIIDMGKKAQNPPESDLIYELSAILIHKGTAVNSGHYVAHIKDENSGQWWEFDDEHVSKLGFHPFGENSSKSSKKLETLQSVDCPVKDEHVVNGGHVDTGGLSVSGSNLFAHEEIFSSTDAYMLMYNCISINGCEVKSHRTCRVDDMGLNAKSSALPLHLSEEIQELNTSYDTACKEYQAKKDSQVAYISERREEVKSFLSEAPVKPLEEPYCWISTDWLRQWSDTITPSSIDNSVIQCSHGKVPITKVTQMKRLSKTIWQKLLSKYGGGPTLTNGDYCIDCIKERAGTSVSADDYRERRASFRELAEACLAGNQPNSSYFVSKTWLVHWLRRKNADCPSDADAGPTSSLRCPHGDLLPEQAAGAKRVVVPESLWLFFYETACSVKPDDLLGCFAFPSDSVPCEICSRDLSEVACLEGSIRAAKLRQRQNHEKLIQGKSFALNPGCKYFLIPSWWLAKWRAYLNATGKNTSYSLEPESLEVIIDSLICKQHSRLLEKPLELVCKRGVINQRVSTTDGLTIIPESDWKLFCEEWNLPEAKGIRAEITLTNSSSSGLLGSCKEMPISDEDVKHSIDESNDELEAREPFIITVPEICESCIGEKESCELMRKLNYSEGDICVHLVRGKEVPRSILEASCAASEPDRRTSKRSRKTSFGNSINLNVSATTSIYQLKMMIWEAFGVVKENQKLHKGSVEIEGDTATLADKNIFPGDVLWVRDTEIHENRDIADELSEQKTEAQLVEEGFRGTLLISDVYIQDT
ncbi:ubiquitin carboxyl-terminal hydrolase 48 protein [Dioscorea alata]|uniref:Ubiquitin carboxyl-terminal hydrolase 48 protein n=3 Tax=Dioscorea alata TaxID=55571 RepID=A0ACB7U786_DIOAL|nr:ubiquitin carboxyl-terminal hydrolase 48 protein [Dioscorea alata]KAH7656176.1 ubiquitin carboxyl-terminal hydrolase 48 protein [Dioscorea alata]KAH7656177.1 ubiquitin carboxyl-terminal hydrolase 48 protein [Dioscorea alata]